MNENEMAVPETTPVEDTTTVETIYVPVFEERPIMTTSFADYTVTEGLLLLVFVLLLLRLFLDLLGRWF